MAEPSIEESARLLRRMHSAGTVKRVDFLHEALKAAYKVGRRDGRRDALAEISTEKRDQQAG